MKSCKRWVGILKSFLSLAFFIVTSVMGFKQEEGFQIGKMKDVQKGHSFGKEAGFKLGMPEAFATCGMGMGCSGGGGVCGMGMGCSGGGGHCGMGMGCSGSGKSENASYDNSNSNRQSSSGGGGVCGMGMGCSGGGGVCGMGMGCSGGGGVCGMGMGCSGK